MGPGGGDWCGTGHDFLVVGCAPPECRGAWRGDPGCPGADPMPRELPHNRHPAQTVGVSGVGGFQWATNPSDPAPETAPAEGRLVPLSDSNYTIRTATNKSQPACLNGINSPCRSEHCGVDRVANPANLATLRITGMLEAPLPQFG